MNNGSLLNLNPSARWGLSSNDFQIRPIVDFDNPDRSAIFDRDQCVAFDGVDLERAKLAECNLTRASFRDANLSNASLWHSDCKDAVFDGANLEEADLDFANLDGCSFKNAKIKKAIFPFTRLPLEDVALSVRTGRKVHMERRGLDDE